MGRWVPVAGAVLVGLGVLLGAFGAHTLKELVTAERLATFETGVRYQIYHGLGLLALAALGRSHGPALRAAPFLLSGTIVFAGALYTLTLGGPGWFGLVAPVGGMLLAFGWAVAAVNLARAG